VHDGGDPQGTWRWRPICITIPSSLIASSPSRPEQSRPPWGRNTCTPPMWCDSQGQEQHLVPSGYCSGQHGNIRVGVGLWPQATIWTRHAMISNASYHKCRVCDCMITSG
jgi:hypothetical protein